VGAAHCTPGVAPVPLPPVQPIFVGDVQGCAEELKEILARARARFGESFQAFFVGDLVNRGPQSLRALELVHGLVEKGRAHYVLGNHELGLLGAGLGLRAMRPLDTAVEILESPDASFWIEWIRRRPLVVEGVLGDRPFAMVHAAAHPDWGLAELMARARAVQTRLSDPNLRGVMRFLGAEREGDPERDLLDRLLHCRSIPAPGRWSRDEPGKPDLAWHAAWLKRGHHYGVVYGHWAMQGLHVAAGLRGLDTGCVHHGRGRVGLLTAWLPDLRRKDPFQIPDEAFWQVQARRKYYIEAGGEP
jgi:bis(5'-nucleosyl)-tetraphosphatase (symmetrical)